MRGVARWDDAVGRLSAFATAHGHARVPAGFVCEDGMRLGAWVMHRRAERRRGARSLTAERIRQLDAVGFDWNPPRGRTTDEFAEQWDTGVAHLEQYRAEHGHTAVPLGWVCEDGFRLGRWVAGRRTDRRHNARALTPSRMSQLEAIGFDWGPATTRAQREAAQWAAGVAHLTNYIAGHGHARVPHGWTSSDGYRLGVWVSTRRTDRRRGRPSLTANRIDQLNHLGFHWGTAGAGTAAPRTRWTIAVDHLARFVTAHGHAQVPQTWVSPDGFKLGTWAAQRRYDRRTNAPTLTPDRIAQLDRLGFEWTPPRGPGRSR
ncbi:helicase associated domain-containing protein [Rhodococcus sp. TAF43]|uniref:helicase associated domain-containing protein n=1 Tax=Rhodococcus sp. TAF43 TaxID=3237483 RepID=UPI003F983F96